MVKNMSILLVIKKLNILVMRWVRFYWEIYKSLYWFCKRERKYEREFKIGSDFREEIKVWILCIVRKKDNCGDNKGFNVSI